MTIKDIARIAGVSVSTVSRVLNNHPDVSQEAHDKVMAAVAETKYIPNTSARELGKSSSDNIGLVVRGMSNPFYTKIIAQINADIEKNGYTMVMQQIGTQDDEVMAGALMERDKRLQGLIFLGGRNDYSEDQVSCINVPFVCCSYSNKYGTLGKNDYSSVSIDDNKSAYDAVEKLYNEGHRRIAVLLARTDDESVSQMRYEGYERALNDFGISFDDDLVIKIDSYNISDSYEGMKEWLKRDIDATAIFAISDNLALGAMRAIIESGKKIPDDYAIVAIDGIEVSEYMNPQLSTLCQPMQEMGRRSVQLLVDIIEKKGGHKQVVLPTTYREGNTLC